MGTREDEDEARSREANRILKAIREETDPQTGTHVQNWLLRPKEFFAADDADPDDRIEKIGLRIGRVASVVGFVVFAIILYFQFVS
ncbi:pyridoxine kinase [Fulvimarina pelagi HTCC2506]|uniref:Pyridoxine kinase n=1 Tax=Fulvimarina pelagi HTCC2506 TaxID=314231 RepID=Q0G3M1_9HYPH|nr:hypothetical protein [Fulvimarina pelagi]EAU41810.1 pyridoxine kinase [Fulvimarina pelagi HTCC2506]